MRPRAHQPDLLEWIMRTIKHAVDHRFTSLEQAREYLASHTGADGEEAHHATPHRRLA